MTWKKERRGGVKIRKLKFILYISIILLCCLIVIANVNFLWNILNPIFYRDILNKYAGIYKIDPLLVAAIIKVESKFSPKVQSPVGAIGLMQIMPGTGKEIAQSLRVRNFTTADLYIPEINIRFGFYYISCLRKEFGDDIVAILAAYNAGKKNVKNWLGQKQKLTIDAIPYKETENFVQQVLRTYRHLKILQRIRKSFQFIK